MTNSDPTAPTDIDIRASADRVIDLIRQGETEDGLRQLEGFREGERAVVQEALDRYVADAALQHVWERALAGTLAAEHRPALERLQQALGLPRMPEVNHPPGDADELAGLTPAQIYDVYASVVQTRGDERAKADLERDDYSVLVGMRRETSIFASPDGGRAGTGVYDDQIIVLMRDAAGVEDVFITARASTEPTAQYSHHAGSDGGRYFSDGTREERRIAPSAGYEQVRPRTIQGEDVNDDTMRDLGRLSDGTFEFRAAEHRNPRSIGTTEAFRPSREQLAPERRTGLVQRDTNGDGQFNDADVFGIQDLNSTFKIHGGSRGNTDSAGCQTIHADDYRAFISAARRNPGQDRWLYVLTSTHDGLLRGRDAPRVPEAEAGADENPQQLRERNPLVPGEPQPFANPALNRYLDAVVAGDAALADRIALGFAVRMPEAAVQADSARAGADQVRVAQSDQVRAQDLHL